MKASAGSLGWSDQVYLAALLFKLEYLQMMKKKAYLQEKYERQERKENEMNRKTRITRQFILLTGTVLLCNQPFAVMSADADSTAGGAKAEHEALKEEPDMDLIRGGVCGKHRE